MEDEEAYRGLPGSWIETPFMEIRNAGGEQLMKLSLKVASPMTVVTAA